MYQAFNIFLIYEKFISYRINGEISYILDIGV